MQRTGSFLISGILLALLTSTFLASGSVRAASSVPNITCKQWNYVTSPNPSTSYNYLEGVVALSSTDVWAVGGADNSSSTTQTLAEHYDGTQWNVVSTPSPAGTQGAYLFGAAAVSTSDVWAVGYYFDNTSLSHTLIEHWNGTAWSIVPSPTPSSTLLTLTAMAAISNNNIWAVGWYHNSNGDSNALIEHWNGTSWKIVAGSKVGSQQNELYGISRIPGTSTLWAMGLLYTNSGDQTLTEYYC